VRVIAIDPGTTTGWLTFTPVHRLQIQVHEWGETIGPVAFGRWLVKQHRTGEFDLALVEDWIPYLDGRRRTWEPDPLHVIGMCRMIFGDENCYLGQSAADAMQWGTDGKISPYRDHGPRVGQGRGAKGHALMALRHGLCWTANHWNGIR